MSVSISMGAVSTVKLASSLNTVTISSTVSIPAGQTSATFTVKTTAVASSTLATISANLGSVTVNGSLTITPPTVASVTISPAVDIGLTASTGTVNLSGPAPTGGMSIQLSSNRTAATIPTTVTVPSGSSKATFAIKTLSVASQTEVTLTATLNGGTATGTLTVNPPAILSLTLSPASVKGGKSSTGTVSIGTAAPVGGLTVTITSSSSSATVPATITIPAGKTSGTFSVTTTAVTAQSSTTISAAIAGGGKSATLKITP